MGINLSESKKVYYYLRYVYNLTSQDYTKTSGLNLAGYCGQLGLDGIYYDLVKSNHLDFDKQGKAFWIASEPSVQMANALIKKANETNQEKVTAMELSSNKNKKWADEEVEEMHELRSKGMSIKQIANKLKRSYSAVENKYYTTLKHKIHEKIKNGKSNKDLGIKFATPVPEINKIPKSWEKQTEEVPIVFDYQEEINNLKQLVSFRDSEIKDLHGVLYRIRPIENEKEYTQSLDRISELMNNCKSQIEEQELSILGCVVSDYENDKHPIINYEDYHLISKKTTSKLLTIFLALFIFVMGYLVNFFI